MKEWAHLHSDTAHVRRMIAYYLLLCKVQDMVRCSGLLTRKEWITVLSHGNTCMKLLAHGVCADVNATGTLTQHSGRPWVFCHCGRDAVVPKSIHFTIIAIWVAHGIYQERHFTNGLVTMLASCYITTPELFQSVKVLHGYELNFIHLWVKRPELKNYPYIIFRILCLHSKVIYYPQMFFLHVIEFCAGFIDIWVCGIT